MAILNQESTLPDREYIAALERWVQWATAEIEQLKLDVVEARS